MNKPGQFLIGEMLNKLYDIFQGMFVSAFIYTAKINILKSFNFLVPAVPVWEYISACLTHAHV